MNVTISDLSIYDDSIESTKKFPLEVYFSDKTRSFDVEHYNKGTQRIPLGVIIDNTIYALPGYLEDIDCGKAETYCSSALGYGFTGILPTETQIIALTENLNLYNQISVFLGHGELHKTSLAIAHTKNGSNWQNYYDMKRGITSAHNSWVNTLPIINLPVEQNNDL